MELDLGQPQPKQLEFMQAKNLFVAYGGARGGGKSWALRTKYIGTCLKHPGMKCLLIRQTYQDLYLNHIVEFERTLKPLIDAKLVKHDKEHHLFTFWNGSMIACGYCSNASDLEHYQGQSYDFIALDEATQHPFETFSALGACIRGSEDLPKRFYLTCNPGGIGHEWVKRLFIDRKYDEYENAEDYTFIAAKAEDNVYNGAEYMKMLNQLKEPLRSAWRDGSWDVFSGQFFPEWNDDRLSVDPFPIPANWTVSMSIDYGLDCFAPIWYLTDESGVDYIIAEHAESDLIPKRAAEVIRRTELRLGIADRQIRRFAPPDLFSRQSSTGISVVEQFRREGLYFMKSDNDREAGWVAVKDKLQQETLKTWRGVCPELSRCMHLIQFDIKKPNDCMKDPHDITHLPDSLRYYCVMRGRRAKPVPVYRSGDNLMGHGGRIVRSKPKVKVDVLRKGWSV